MGLVVQARDAEIDLLKLLVQKLKLQLECAPGRLAAEALRRIGALYDIEQQIRGQQPEVRKAQRGARAGPLPRELRERLDGLLRRVSAASDLAQAVGYGLTRWQALVRDAGNRRLEIDHSATERTLRGAGPGPGRKNYLFMGSGAGGERAAAPPREEGRASVAAIDARLLERLLQASHLLPFQLNAAIERIVDGALHGDGAAGARRGQASACTRACAVPAHRPQRLPLRREGGLRGQAPERHRRNQRAHPPAHCPHRSR